MPTLVAIDIRNDMATLVAAETTAAGTINVLESRRVSVTELASSPEPTEATDEATETSTEEEEDYAAEGTYGSEEDELEGEEHVKEAETNGSHAVARTPLEELLNRPIDSTLATLPAEHVLFEYLTLPFRDQTKIDQTVPLQIQDLVPFELEQFIVDSVVVGEQEGGSYNVVSSLVPEKDVQGALETLLKIGADPKLLTTKAAALTALPQFMPEQLSGTYALVTLNADSYSFVAFADNRPCLLRETSFTGNDRYDLAVLAQEIRCSLAKLDVDLKTHISQVFAIGMSEAQMQAVVAKGIPLVPLDLSTFVQQEETLLGSANDNAWAIALFAHELASQRRSRSRLIDFRRGNYAYKPAWSNLWGSLREEIYYIGLAVFFAVVWVVTVLYTNGRNLDRIETAIQEVNARLLPGVSLTEKQEVSQAQQRLEELKTQLDEFGSIAQLSPLESVRSVTAAIPKNLDATFDAVNIGREGMSFSGSVPENRQIGELSKVLSEQTGRFCNVSVEPKGKVPGSNRVRFNADMTFCQ